MKTLIATIALFVLAFPALAQNCTTQYIGGIAYLNCSGGLSGNSQTIGNATFQNFSDGTSVNSQRIGNTTFSNFSNGHSCTTQYIGATAFTNCYRSYGKDHQLRSMSSLRL